jgi:hypothetical protein
VLRPVPKLKVAVTMATAQHVGQQHGSHGHGCPAPARLEGKAGASEDGQGGSRAGEQPGSGRGQCPVPPCPVPLGRALGPGGQGQSDPPRAHDQQRRPWAEHGEVDGQPPARVNRADRA